MLYKVKSKETLKALYDFFCERGVTVIDPLTETELEVEVNEETQAEFETTLSVYISYKLFARIVTNKLNTMMIEEDLKHRFLHEAERYFVHSPYWKGLTLILVSSYFERSDSINIESFMLFNMKGYKVEIEKYIDTLLAAPDQDDFDDEGEQELSIKELFEELRATVQSLDLDLTIFETIHLRQNGETLEFKTEEGTVIDHNFFMYHMGKVLVLETQGARVQWERDIMLLPSICMLFPVKQVVIHKITDDVKAVLEFAKQMISSDLSSASFIDCTDCEDCNE